eukprot:5624994-Alexandrium_andersonii.AAC.1
MSASLVGSEMCIRDSPPGTPKNTSGVRRRHFLPGSWGAVAPPVRKGGGGCLLYTSDAADDM